MRVLVCGGRDFDDWDLLDKTLRALDVDEVIHGGARGADRLAGRWARKHTLEGPLVFAAEWEKHGKAAGPIRNQQMLNEGRPDLVVAFPGGRGTEDMIRRAEKAGVKVHRAAAAGTYI